MESLFNPSSAWTKRLYQGAARYVFPHRRCSSWRMREARCSGWISTTWFVSWKRFYNHMVTKHWFVHVSNHFYLAGSVIRKLVFASGRKKTLMAAISSENRIYIIDHNNPKVLFLAFSITQMIHFDFRSLLNCLATNPPSSTPSLVIPTNCWCCIATGAFWKWTGRILRQANGGSCNSKMDRQVSRFHQSKNLDIWSPTTMRSSR